MTAIRINIYGRMFPVELTNKRNGGGVVGLDFNFVHPRKGLMWLCRCPCGYEFYVGVNYFGQKLHCGCKSKKTVCHFPSAYKDCVDFERLTSIYTGMRSRCYDWRSENYSNYGARGITICDEWLKDRDRFIAWSLANGYEWNLTIDRKDNYKGYSESNCRWITLAEQQKNKRVHQDAREAAATAQNNPL